MAAKQEIHENGRVSALLQWLLGIAASLVTAAVIAQAAISWRLNNEIAGLNTEIALLNFSNRTRDNEHSDLRNAINLLNQENQKQDNEHAALDRRITEIERQRDR